MEGALDEVLERAKACTRCPLYKTRTNLVFGRGPADARIMLIGEAPGKNEDLQGQPFVGAAGHTLKDVLATADIDMEEVYIANILKCRPPNNRDPQPDEISACTQLLDAQIAAIDPDVIVCLGRYAAQHMLGEHADGVPMANLHGHVWQVDGRYVVPVYHPAATIYDRTKLPALTHDLKGVKKLVERADKRKSQRWRA